MENKERLLGSQLGREALSKEPELSWLRFSVFFWFNIAVFMNSLPGEIYVPIAGYLQDIYGTSESIMTLATTSYMFMHPILSIPSSQLIVKIGWAKATNVGVVLTILGSAIKLLVDQTGFWIIVAAQFMIGAGKPLILNSQGEMASRWFKEGTRQSLFTILNIFNVVSNVVTMLIPGKWIYQGYNEDQDKLNDYSDGKERFLKLQWVMFYFSLTMIPCIIFLSSNPKNFRPQDSSLMKSARNTSVKENLLRVMQRVDFIKCFISYSIYIGMLKSVVITLPYMFKAFGFQAGVVSIAGSCAYVASVLSQTFIMGFASSAKTRKKLFISVLMIMSTITAGLLYISLSTEKNLVVYANIAMIGFSAMPIIPLMMDLACDIIPKSSSSYGLGIMYIGSQLNIVLFSQVFSVTIGGSHSSKYRVLLTLGLLMLFFIAGLVIFWFIKISPQNKVYSIPSSRSHSSMLDRYHFFNFASDVGQISVIQSEKLQSESSKNLAQSSELVDNNEQESKNEG